MSNNLEKEFDEILNSEIVLAEFGEKEIEALKILNAISDPKLKIAIMKFLKYYYNVGYDYGRTDHEFLDDPEEDEEEDDEDLEEENEIKDDCISEEEIPNNLC